MMTKKKNAWVQMLGLCAIFISALILTGCGDADSPLEDIAFEGDEYFVTSDVGNITNYEMFNGMIGNLEVLPSLIDLVDFVLLYGEVEIDESIIERELAIIVDNVPDLDLWLVQTGFETEANFVRFLTLQELRTTALRPLVNVTDEEIEQMFEGWLIELGFDLTDIVFDEEGLAAEGLGFEEWRDPIYNMLTNRAIEEIMFEELASMRYEAGFEIFHETIAQHYRYYLEMMLFDTELSEATTRVSDDVIARINGINITIGQLFYELTFDLGFDVAFEEIDSRLLAEESLEERLKPSEERIREIYEGATNLHIEMYTDLVERPDSMAYGSHILVDDYDVAVELIQQLQQAADMPELFAELAISYSNCGSSVNGGNLGYWTRGQMVGPFDEAFFDLEKGTFTTSPVETQHGYHIIFRPLPSSDVPDFEELRDEIITEETNRLIATPGVVPELMLSLRQDVNVVFTNPTLQANYELFIEQMNQ